MWGERQEASRRNHAERERMVLADGSYMQEERPRGRLSAPMALILGILITIELMVGGAMILNIDFFTADVIALGMSFMVLYFGVVAVLAGR